MTLTTIRSARAFLLTFFMAPIFLASAQLSPVSDIYDFPAGSWIENLAGRPFSSSILATRADTPSLYQAPDAFAVIVGNFSLTEVVPSTWSIWSVRFTHPNRQPIVRKITDVVGGGLLNGMTTLSRKLGTILIGDCVHGQVYRLNVQNGDYEVVLDDATMKRLDTPTSIGVNGIQKVTINGQSYLYYDNTAATSLNRVRINPLTGRAAGPFTTITDQLSIYPNDFAYDYATGDIYLAGTRANAIVKVSPDGDYVPIAEVNNPTSVRFGWGEHSQTLYVTSYGRGTEGARLVAVEP